jgi:type IX secretion system PorP/SprF family membrane protein
MKHRSGEYRVVSGEHAYPKHHSPLRTRRSRSHALLTALVWLCAVPSLVAQDIHFSQFFQTPYALTPANIGLFDGDHRIAGVFRQQWRAVTTPYRTFGIGGDAANAFGIDGLGAGVWLYNDRAGDSRFNTFHISVGGSWTERFGDSREHCVTGGLQVGLTTISINYADLQFDSQYNGFAYDPSLSNGESFARDALVHPDVHVGGVYRYHPAKRELVQAGFGLFNLTRPRIGFFNAEGDPLDLRTTFHVLTQFPVSEKVDVLPMFQYMGQGPFSELDLGGIVRYILKDRYGVLRAVQGGFFYRAADAGYVHAGLEHDDWTFGVSYDINFSDLVPASRNRGGIEFTAVHIFRKRPMVPARFKACPDLL